MRNEIQSLDYFPNRGCTRYFCSKEADAALPANRKSKDHLSKGSLKDAMIDDIRNFQTVDQASIVKNNLAE
jgi:myosin-6